MPGVDDDVLGHCQGSGKLKALGEASCHGQRWTRLRHGMQIEQIIDAIIERAQLTRAGKLQGLTRSVEHIGAPESIEVFVDASRGERIVRIKALIRRDVGEDHRKSTVLGPQRLAQHPIEDDSSRYLVAVGERLEQNVRSWVIAGE